jgi:hypothetical protein
MNVGHVANMHAVHVDCFPSAPKNVIKVGKELRTLVLLSCF